MGGELWLFFGGMVASFILGFAVAIQIMCSAAYERWKRNQP